MGIKVEYNPDLALRDYQHFLDKKRQEAECIPQNLTVGATYPFLKKDQRLYWLHGEIPLLQTEGNEKLSLPIASIIINEATHTLRNGEVWTSGTYTVQEIFTDDTPRFNGFAKLS